MLLHDTVPAPYSFLAIIPEFLVQFDSTVNPKFLCSSDLALSKLKSTQKGNYIQMTEDREEKQLQDLFIIIKNTFKELGKYWVIVSITEKGYSEGDIHIKGCNVTEMSILSCFILARHHIYCVYQSILIFFLNHLIWL